LAGPMSEDGIRHTDSLRGRRQLPRAAAGLAEAGSARLEQSRPGKRGHFSQSPTS
jgi:hypothetical protein